MNVSKKLLLLLCLGLFVQMVKAQTVAEGFVKDERSLPLQGATVTEKGVSSNAAVTDSLGHFILLLKGKSQQLIISYVGYDVQEEKYSGRILEISLTRSRGNLNDVVVIGYQNQKRRNVTAAVSSLNGDVIKNIPDGSFDQMLQGKLAGVNVQTESGQPGAKQNITIRGSTNVDYDNANGGNTAPLYVIDGIIYDVNNFSGTTPMSNPLSLINPNDIESIDVLKDASAAAIYGARGGNGVIIVKTKGAKKTLKPDVVVSGYFGFTSRPQLRQVQTGVLERRLKLRLLQSQLPYYDFYQGSIPQALTDSLNPAFNNDVDWQGMLIRNTALVNNEDFSMSGFFGGNNSYRLSLNHYSEQGAVKGFSLDKIAPNLNITLNPMKNLAVNANLQMAFLKTNHGAGTDYYNPFLFSTWNFPSSFAQLSSETKALYDGSSNRYDDNRNFSLNANVQVTDTLMEGLLLTATIGTNIYNDKYAYFSPKELNGIQNTAYDIENTNPNWSFETYAQYSKNIKENHFVLVGGFSAYKAQSYNQYSYASGINVSGIYTLQTVPPGSNLFISTSKDVKTTASYYGRLSYDYNGKYLLTASFRRDASSIYSPEYQWGTFSAVSAGWILSDESFFEPLKNAINFLKLRASYGVTGQDPGSWYSRYQTLYADASYLGATTGTVAGDANYSYLGGTPSTYNGTTVITPFGYNNGFVTYAIKSSPGVRWEEYPQIDIGGDMELFKSRIVINVDWYQKDANNKFLWSVPADPTTGYQYYSGNYANVRNRGLEITLNTHNLSPKSAFQWNTNFNISFNKNWITKLPNDDRDLLFGEPWFRKTLTLGSPLFSYKLWQTDGVYTTDADVPVDPITGNRMSYFGTPLQAGDSKIIDQNGDYNIDYDDQVPDGSSPLPKFNGGFGNTFIYKNFSLYVFASYSFGNKILNGSLSDDLNGSAYYSSSWGAVAGPAGFGEILNEFWQNPGDQTIYPRYVYSINGAPWATDPWNISRSYFLESGDYIKLKQVTLSYNFPQSIAQRLHMKALQVYASGFNLYTWKKAKDIPDPELYNPTTGSVNIVYPTAAKFTFGLQVNF